MTSCRANITAALVARLKSPPSGVTMPADLAAAQIHRYALRSLEAETLPALVVYRFDNAPIEGNHIAGESRDNLLAYEVKIRVEIRALGEPVDEIVEPLEEYVRQCVFADSSLGGLAAGCREIAYEVDGMLGNQSYAASYVSFGFLYYEQPYVFTETGADLALVQTDNTTLDESFTVPA